MKERTTCFCCHNELQKEKTQVGRVYYTTPAGSRLWNNAELPTRGRCRLCSSDCCARCLTLDGVCDTCLVTLD